MGEQMGAVRNVDSCRAVMDAIVAAGAAPGVAAGERRAMAAEGTAVLRAALAAPGPAVDAACFRQVCLAKYFFQAIAAWQHGNEPPFPSGTSSTAG